MSRRWQRMLQLLATGLLALACAGPPAPGPDESVVYGTVRLVPRAGVTLPRADGAYGDRRLRGVDLVDYSRPGFAVVYLEDARPAPVQPATLAVRDLGLQADLIPEHAAVAVGSRVLITNRSLSPHILSCPRAGIVQRLAPGDDIAIGLPEEGEYEIFLLDVAGAVSRIFVAPGPFAVVSDSGRYVLSSGADGRHTLRTWHPRFPPTARTVHLTMGSVTPLDLEIGVGQPDEASHD